MSPIQTEFEKRALILINKGIPTIPVPPKQKGARLLNWQELATTDLQKLLAMSPDPDSNTAAVAKAVPGGFCFFEIDRPHYREVIQQETGQEFPKTFCVASSGKDGGRGHFYFRHTAASIALGNKAYYSAKDEQGELWSFRVNNAYVVGPNSIHPDGPTYTIVKDAQISDVPDWLVNFAKTHDVSASSAPGKTNEVHEGHRNNTLTSELGKLRQNEGLEFPELFERGLKLNESCVPPLSKNELETIAHSVARYAVKPRALAILGSSEIQKTLAAAIRAANPKADEAAINRIVTLVMGADKWTEKPREEKTAPPIETTVNIPSSAFTSTRLGDIFADMFAPNDWPLTLALPALVTAASVVVPPMPRGEGELIVGDDPMVTLYTALIADVHAGKSQVNEWACRAIGIYPPDGSLGSHYYEGKWGSGEQLLKALYMKNSKFPNKSALICADEWAHLFSKAAIPNASFPSVLTTAFYRRTHNFSLSGENGGREYTLNLAMSFIGGIVEADFDTVFGSGSLGGLYDRFLFGHAPEEFHWQYRPCPIISAGQWSTWGIKPVHLDDSVFEETRTWDKDGQMGRIVEVCIRIATIFASVDGRQKITGKDLEPLRPLAQYQLGLRAKFSPNAGVSPEAIFANKALGWINKDAMGWKNIADLKQALWRLEERLGPNVAERSLASAARGGKIDLWMAFNNTDKATGEISYPADYDGPNVRTGLVRRVY